MTQRLDYDIASPAGVKASNASTAMSCNAACRKHSSTSSTFSVSQINGCSYCIDMHSSDLLKHGMKLEKLLLLPVWRELGTGSTPPNGQRSPGRRP